MADDRELVTLFTAAPDAYDGFSTRTVRVVGKDNRRGGPVREVTVERRDYEWQTGRYGSGMCSYTHERMALADYVRFGDWTLSEGRPKFVQGERVKANHPIVDESGWDKDYRVERGDLGTIRSLDRIPESHESARDFPLPAGEFGVEWDKFPGVINAVHPDRIDPA